MKAGEWLDDMINEGKKTKTEAKEVSADAPAKKKKGTGWEADGSWLDGGDSWADAATRSSKKEAEPKKEKVEKDYDENDGSWVDVVTKPRKKSKDKKSEDETPLTKPTEDIKDITKTAMAGAVGIAGISVMNEMFKGNRK
jgi:hypothetical protein